MVTWKNKDIDIKTIYTIEYIDNKKDLEYVYSGKINQGEPWERYKKKVFEDAGEAMTIFLLYLTNDAIYDVQLFEEIKINNETIREAYIEPENTFLWSLKRNVNKTMQKQLEDTQKANTEAEKILEIYKDFIKAAHAEKLFQDFIR